MAGFADFIKHRKYFVCVSPATLDWYEHCFHWIPESPSQADLQNAVIARAFFGSEYRDGLVIRRWDEFQQSALALGLNATPA